MPQFFVGPEVLRQTPIVLRGPDARHVASVLRLGPGDWIILCDGAGGRCEAEITAIRPLHVELRVRQTLPPIVIAPEITLAAAVIRPERYEWLIEKAFELGCRRLIPLVTERTVAGYLKDERKQQARWKGIAYAAAKQSGLPWMPEIAAVTPLADLLHQIEGPLYFCWEGLAAEPRSEVHHLHIDTPTHRHSILIGPEGGFTAAERDAVMTHHPTILPLGPLILRTETAALSAIIRVQAFSVEQHRPAC